MTSRELDELIRLSSRRPVVRRLMQAVTSEQLVDLTSKSSLGVTSIATEYLYARRNHNAEDPDTALATSERLDTLWTPVEPVRSDRRATMMETAGDAFRTCEHSLRREWRRCVSEKLPPDPELIAGMAQGINSMPLRQAVVAARLLSLAPAAAQSAALKQVWLLVEQLGGAVERSPDRHTAPRSWDSVSTVVAQAGYAVSEALARSTAASGATVDLEQDEELCHELRTLEDQIRPILDTYRRRADEYHQLGPGLQLGPATLDQVRHLRYELGRLELQLVPLLRAKDLAWNTLRHRVSAAWLFLTVLRTASQHATATLQAAIGGLGQLLRSGVLSASSRNQVRTTMAAALMHGHGVRERMVLVLPEADKTEFAHALEEGLAWILAADTLTDPDVVPQVPVGASGDDAAEPPLTSLTPTPPSEFQVGDGPSPRNGAGEDYSTLHRTVDVMLEHIPGLLKFVERYPIRLMTSEDLKGAFGVYSREGATIELWYRYDRPQERGGRVSERYLQLQDRTKPNSIGLHYRLLQHALLCCPVLFHEMMHYGGLDNDPAEGVDNELYVLICEIAFAKALLSRLAPIDPAAIPDYERNLVTMCDRLGHHGLLLQCLDEIDQDTRLAYYNTVIPFLYASRRSPDQAMAWQNRSIEWANRALTWCAWIRWPTLGNAQTILVTNEYRAALNRHASARHTLTAVERDRLLSTGPIPEYLAEWQGYKARVGSLRALQAARDEVAARERLGPEALCRLAAIRYSTLLAL